MARKKIKLENGVTASVPLSSMIDVVFLLLIYFILTQKPVVEDVHLQLDLPSPSAGAASDKLPQLLRIDVMKLPGVDNDEWVSAQLAKATTQQEINKVRAQEKLFYHVNTTGDNTGTPMSIQDLRNYLQKVAEGAPDTTIVINCGPNAKHKKLVRLLDLCDELGLTHLNLLNDATVQFIPDPAEKRK